MDPVATINAAVIGINALLQVVANLRVESGLTDDQLAVMFRVHGQQTHDAIAGYLASLPIQVTGGPVIGGTVGS